MRRFGIVVLLGLAAALNTCAEPVAPDPGVPSVLQLLRGDDQTGTPGAALDSAIVVRVQDGRGTSIAGVTVLFTVVTGGGSIQPQQVVTGPSGTAAAQWVLGDLVYTEQRAIAMVLRPGAAPIETVITAAAAPTGPVAIVRSVQPAVLEPGATLFVTGDSLIHVTSLTVAGRPATITAQSATTLQAQVSATGYECMPTQAVPVILTAPAGRVQHLQRMRVAPEREIAVGQALVSSPADRLTCVELPEDGGRYIITVANVSEDTAHTPGLRLRGLAAGAAASTAALAAAPDARVERSATGGSLWASTAYPSGLRHGRHAQFVNRAARPSIRVPARPDPVVGEIVTIRVPRPTATDVDPCAAYDPIQTRVVHVGARVAVLEDVNQPFVGTLNEEFRLIADEYDNLQYPVLLDNFGVPPGTNDKLLIVFSRRVNTFGLSGFVWAGDLEPRSSCTQSNEAPVFYGYLPTVVGDGYAAGTRAEWLWSIRPTIVHEAKHLTSMTSRYNAGLIAQEPWLEEAGAMVAEELWARQLFGYEKGGNVTFEPSVGCEIDGAFDRPPCRDKPGAMFAHFTFLAGWLAQPGTSSILGPTSAGDISYYGSSWLFLRWLLDHADRPESELLMQLTTSQLTGVSAVEAAFDRPFEEMLPEWAAAVALDDRPNVSMTGRYHIPSWDLRDVYSGLNREQPNIFPTTFPLRIRALSYGDTQTDITVVRGGGAAYFDLSGDPVGRQALSFAGLRSAVLSDRLRIVIVRIE